MNQKHTCPTSRKSRARLGRTHRTWTWLAAAILTTTFSGLGTSETEVRIDCFRLLIDDNGAEQIIYVGSGMPDELQMFCPGGVGIPGVGIPALPVGPPGAPTELAAGPGSDLEVVHLEWRPPQNDGGLPVTGYKVYRGATDTTLNLVAQQGPNPWHNDISASANRTYYYRVSALNAMGQGPVSAAANVTTPARPGQAGNLSALPTGVLGEIRLEWQPPADTGGSPIVGYRVYQGVDGEAQDLLAEVQGAVAFNDSSCAQGHSCQYTVTALDSAGSEGPKSNATLVVGTAPVPEEAAQVQRDWGVPLPADPEAIELKGLWEALSIDEPVPDPDPDPSPLGPECELEASLEEGLGLACYDNQTGLWKIHHEDGNSSYTHAPTDVAGTGAAYYTATPRKPMCVDDPKTQPHFVAVYAHPNNNASRYPSLAGKIRAAIYLANGYFRQEAAPFGKLADLKGLCDYTGEIFIDKVKLATTTSSSDSFKSITDDLRKANYKDNKLASYWVFYDDDVRIGSDLVCGQGTPEPDPILKRGNKNNVGGRFAVVYGENCFAIRPTGYAEHAPLHEYAHVMGAVQGGQDGAPHRSYHWHCNDGKDLMCYDDREKNEKNPNHAAYKPLTYSETACPNGERFDCNNDDYFDPFPTGCGTSTPEHLCNNWNLGGMDPADSSRPVNNWIYYHNDCATSGNAGDTFAAASFITLDSKTCTGALADGDGEDWYRFQAFPGERLIFSMRPRSSYSDFSLCLWKPTGAPARCNSAGAGAVSRLNLVVGSGDGGYWRAQVLVKAASKQRSGEYTMDVRSRGTDCGAPNDDAGGTTGAAFGVTLPADCLGSLGTTVSGATDRQDWYQVTLSTGGQLSISKHEFSSNTNFDVCLYNPSGTKVQCVATNSRTESLTWTASTTGTWKIQVLQNTGAGNYKLAIRHVSANDCGTGGGDAGNAHGTATLITPPVTNCQGQIAPPTDKEDWYRFSVGANQWISVSMAPPSGADLDLCLYTPTGSSSPAKCSTLRGSKTESISKHLASTAGEWRVRVYQYTGSGDYRLTLRLYQTQADCGASGDAGNTRFVASTLSLPQVPGCFGKLVPTDDDKEDWYKFNVPSTSGTTIKLRLTPPSGSDYDLCLYKPSRTASVQCSTSPGTSGVETINRAPTETGSWFARVYWSKGPSTGGTYTLRACIHPTTSGC